MGLFLIYFIGFSNGEKCKWVNIMNYGFWKFDFELLFCDSKCMLMDIVDGVNFKLKIL